MGHRFLDHTGEVEVELSGKRAEEVFAEAASALGELLADGEPPGKPARWLPLSLAGGERGRLLVDFLEELIFLAEREGLVPCAATVELTPEGLEGEVGFAERPPNGLVKAATLHNLRFEERPEGVVATVVLDV